MDRSYRHLRNMVRTWAHLYAEKVKLSEDASREKRYFNAYVRALAQKSSEDVAYYAAYTILLRLVNPNWIITPYRHGHDRTWTIVVP